MILSVVKNSWNWNFANFRDLILILPEAATGGVSMKKVFKIFVKFTGKHLCQSLFLSCNFIKFCKIFKNSFSTEYLWMNASILQQLLALYFAIIYS